MEIHYTLNQEDAAAFLKHGQQQLPRWVVVVLVPCFALLVSSPDLLRMYKRGGLSGIAGISWLSVLLPILFFVAFLGFTSWFNPRSQAAKVAAQPYFLGAQTARLTEEAFHHENESGGSSTRWRFMHEIVDAPDHLFFLLGPGHGHIIPKRAFPNAAESDQFLSRARELQRRATSTEPIASPMR